MPLRTHWLPLGIAAVCLILQLFAEQEAIRYQRELVISGQWWRLLSANFIHLGWGHLGMNMAGLALVYLLVGPGYTQRQWLLITVFCALGVSGGLLMFDPQLRWYVGFSGSLHGVLMAGVIVDIGRQAGRQRLISVALLVGVVAKLAWEQLVGSMPGSAELAGGPVVVNSHLYGAVAGVGAAAAATLCVRLLKPDSGDSRQV